MKTAKKNAEMLIVPMIVLPTAIGQMSPCFSLLSFIGVEEDEKSKL